MPVIFVKTIHYSWTDSPSWLRRIDKDGGENVCRPGTWGAEFYAGIQAEDGEIIIGAHSSWSRREADAKKQKALESAGITLIRWQVSSLPPDEVTIRAAFTK